MMNQLTLSHQKPPHLTTTIHDSSILQGAGDPCLELANQSVEIASYAIEDERFIQLQQASICDRQGIAAPEHGRKSFSKIPKGKAVYDEITGRIKNTEISTEPQSPSSIPSIQDLIIEMFQISHEEGTEETESGLFLVWPAPITEVRLSGLPVLQLLMNDPEHFQEHVDEVFSSSAPSQVIQDFLKLRKRKISQDESMLSFQVIWNGSKDHFKSFAQKMRNFLKNDYAPPSKNFVINEEASSIDVKCHNQTLRFVFLAKSIIHCSEDCLSILLYRLSDEDICQNGTIVIQDHLLGDLELTTGPFSPAQVLIDELCQFYRPVDTNHPDVLLNLLYHGTKMISGIEEKDLVNQFLDRFRSIGDAQAFIKHVSSFRWWNGEYINQLAQRKTTEPFSTGPEEYLAKGLYFYIRRKIESERQHHSHINNPTDAFGFLFRVSQSLSMHSSVDDRVINQLWQWSYEDQLIFPSKNPLQDTIQKLYLTKKIKFAEIIVCLSSLSLLYYPNRFSERQNPSIYFFTEPFVMRLPTQNIEDFRRLNAYLASSKQSSEAFKLICNSFVPHERDVQSLQHFLVPQLEFGELSFTNEVIRLMDHPDPFVSYLAFQVAMMMSNLKNPLLFYVQLPKILSVASSNPKAIHALFKRAKEEQGIDATSVEASMENPLSLESWIRLLALSTEPEVVHIACSMLQEGENVDVELSLFVARQLSRVDPRAAVSLINSRLKQMDPNEALSTAITVLRAYQQPPHLTTQEDLKPIMGYLLRTDKPLQFKDDQQRDAFYHIISFFLESQLQSVKENEADRFILGAVSNGYMAISDLSPRALDRLIFLMTLRPKVNAIKNYDRITLNLCRHLRDQKDSRFFEVFHPLLKEISKQGGSSIFYEFFIDCLDDPRLAHSYTKIHFALLKTASKDKADEAKKLFKDYIQAFLIEKHQNAIDTQQQSIEQAIVRNFPLIKEIEGWENLLLSYLGSVKATPKRLPNLWTIYRETMRKRSLNGSNLRVLVHLLEQSLVMPHLIPVANLTDLKQKQGEIVEVLQRENSFEESQTFLSILRDLDDKIAIQLIPLWNQCKYLLEADEKPLPKVMQLLQDVTPVQLFKILQPDDLSALQHLLNCFVDAYIWNTRTGKIDQKSTQNQDAQGPLKKRPQLYSAKRNEQILKWIKSLLIHSVAPSAKKRELLQIHCDPMDWMNLVEAMLPLESVHLSRFVLCNPSQVQVQLRPVAMQEFEHYMKKKKVSSDELSLCLSLIDLYFSLDVKRWNTFWRALQPTKNRELIDKAWKIYDETSKDFSPSQDLGTCWRTALTCASTHAIDLTKFMQSVPSYFEMPAMRELKTLALVLAFESGIDQLLRAPAGGRKLKQKQLKEQEELRIQLIQTAAKSPVMPFERYLKLLSVLSETTIANHQNSCFTITFQVLNSSRTTDIGSTLPDYSENYRRNFCKLMVSSFQGILQKDFPGDQKKDKEDSIAFAEDGEQNPSDASLETAGSDSLTEITEVFEEFYGCLSLGSTAMGLTDTDKSGLGIALFEEYIRHPFEFSNLKIDREVEGEVLLRIMENRRNFLKVYKEFISFSACDDHQFKRYAEHAFDIFFLIYFDYLRMFVSPKFRGMAEKKMRPIVDDSVELLWANFPDLPDDYLQVFFSRLHDEEKESLSESCPEDMDEIRPIENDETAESNIKNQIKLRLVDTLFEKLTRVTNAASKDGKKALVRVKKKTAKPVSDDKIKGLKGKIAALLMAASEYEIKSIYTQCTDWKELNILLYAGHRNLKQAQSLHIFNENHAWILRYLNLFSPLQTPPQSYVYLTAQDYERQLIEVVNQLISFQTPLSRYCAAYRFGFFMRQSVDTPYEQILVNFKQLASKSAAHPALLSTRQSFLEGLDTFCIRDERNTRKVMIKYFDGTYPYRDLVKIEFETVLEILDKMDQKEGIKFKVHYVSLACSLFFDLLRIHYFTNELESYLDFSSCLTTYVLEVEEELEGATLSKEAALPTPGTFIKKSTSFKLDSSLVSSLLPPTENSREWRHQTALDWFSELEERDKKKEGRCYVLDALSEVVKKKYLSCTDPEQAKIYDSIKLRLEQRSLTEEQAVLLELLDLTFHLKTPIPQENQQLYLDCFISVCEKLAKISISSSRIAEVLDLFDEHIPAFEKTPAEEFRWAYQTLLCTSLSLMRRSGGDIALKYREMLYKYVRRGVIGKLFLPYESSHKQEVLATLNDIKNWISEDANYAVFFELIEHAFYTFHLEKADRPRELAKRLKELEPRFSEHFKKTNRMHYLSEIHSLLAELNQSDRKMIESKLQRALKESKE